MSTDTSETMDLPADFGQRCAIMLARLQADEPMTIEYLADQLGVPYEFLAGALAGYAATLGVLALLDLSPPRPLH
jgi:hypothetical protein